MNTLKVQLQIFRYKQGQSPHYDSFEVDVPDSAHVIDAIDAAWAIHDPTLTFRRACHHSSCGSCAIRINGAEKLPCITCITDVWDSHKPLRLDPLRNFPIVSDLVVDVTSFFQRMSAADMAMTCEAKVFLPFSVDTFAVASLDPKMVELPEPEIQKNCADTETGGSVVFRCQPLPASSGSPRRKQTLGNWRGRTKGPLPSRARKQLIRQVNLCLEVLFLFWPLPAVSPTQIDRYSLTLRSTRSSECS